MDFLSHGSKLYPALLNDDPLSDILSLLLKCQQIAGNR